MAWSIICNETGREAWVDLPEGRWFDARSEGVRLLSAQLGEPVSQDGVKCVWRELDVTVMATSKSPAAAAEKKKRRKK